MAEVFSDYGSGSSVSSAKTWSSQDPMEWSVAAGAGGLSPRLRTAERPRHDRPASLVDLRGRWSSEEAMREFRLNGFDSPYNPDDDRWTYKPDQLSGLGPPLAYLRQKSWPAPESSPAPRLPPAPRTPQPAPEQLYQSAAASASELYPSMFAADELDLSVPADKATISTSAGQSFPHTDTLTAEQQRVLWSLPPDTVRGLLQHLEMVRGNNDDEYRFNSQSEMECRFCKKNRERSSFYRSHCLRDARGRVRCPVLRALVCARCGASGDSAHTIKYCRLTTIEERRKSDALLRSMRTASSRRRHSYDQYVVFGEASPAALQDSYSRLYEEALDPLWAALEAKLKL